MLPLVALAQHLDIIVSTRLRSTTYLCLEQEKVGDLQSLSLVVNLISCKAFLLTMPGFGVSFVSPPGIYIKSDGSDCNIENETAQITNIL